MRNEPLPELQIVSRPAHPLNYGSRRDTRISIVIVHATQGDCPDEKKAQAAVNWFANPDAQASAHYVIAHNGVVYQCVEENEAAWHAGNGVYNRRSIGIECAGDCYQKAMWTPALMASLAALTASICKRHEIPVDREHIIGHDVVPDPRDPSKFGGHSHHTDPGKFFPWDRFIQSVKGSGT